MATDLGELDANKRLVRRLHDVVWTAGEIGAIDGLLASGHLERTSIRPRQIRGRAAYKAHVAAVRSAFAGFEVVPEDVIAEGDIVAFRHTVRGTHDGELGSIPATGRPFEISGVAVHRVDAGRIAESWVTIDALGLLHQLDVLTPPWLVPPIDRTDETSSNATETDHGH